MASPAGSGSGSGSPVPFEYSPVQFEYYEYSDGTHDMYEDEQDEYYRAYEASEGFDMPSFPKAFAYGLIVPMSDRSIVSHDVRGYADEAIKHYNKENGTNLEIIRIVKANQGPACGIIYYITFEVKEVGSAPEAPRATFQAKVLNGIPDTIEVLLCRPKPDIGSCLTIEDSENEHRRPSC